MRIKIWSLDNLLSLPAETAPDQVDALLLEKLKDLIKDEAEEMVWICVDEYEENTDG